ncbi:MAG: hypothetical protein R6X29_06960 [Acidimicrobiia bacterium]|jgi:uncharacterized protein with PQ loop repeat
MRPADLAVVVATILAAIFLLPQIVKLARTGDSTGVSATWPALGAVTNVGWFAYLSSQQLWLSVPSTVLMMVFYSTVLRYLARTGRSIRGPAIRGLVWGLMLLAVFRMGGWETLGLVLGLSYAVQLAPSVWTAYRTPAPSGISPGTWWLGGIEAVLWGVYGWGYQDVPIMIFAGVGVVVSSLMLGRFYATRHRWQRVPAPA